MGSEPPSPAAVPGSGGRRVEEDVAPLPHLQRWRRVRCEEADPHGDGAPGVRWPEGLGPTLASAPQGHAFAGDVQSSVVRCGATSTSDRAATNGVMSQLYHQGVEIDTLVRLGTGSLMIRLIDLAIWNRVLLIRCGHGL